MHRPIIAVVDGVGMTEQCEAISDLAAFAIRQTHIWITHDPTDLLNTMLATYGDMLSYTFTDSRDPEVSHTMQTARLSAFGFAKGSLAAQAYGKQAQHSVWHPSRMFSTPRIAADFLGNDHMELLNFAIDVREWCAENNLPLKGTLPGHASSLLRDKRFWSKPRGRVPRMTNERVRPNLPGVYQERRAPKARTFKTAIALDQTRAYHRAAQEVPSPDPTNLVARGYFNDIKNAPGLWAAKGTVLYERTIRQPGLLAVMATCRPKKKDEWRPPACDIRGRTIRYIWSNELQHCESHGMNIEGIVAAWTSETADDGIIKYGAWAETQIDTASEYRRTWLKPTLHSLYGLLGARPRDMLIGRSHSKGVPTIYTMRGYAYPVNEITVKNNAPPTVNVAALGTLQAAIRQRTLDLANVYGQSVLHVHADGLHLEATQLEFIPHGWTVESVTNLYYLDDVSWTSDQRDVLPGRDQWERAKLRERLQRDFERASHYFRKRSASGGQDRAA